MAKKNAKARLRLKLQQVTKERDLYEIKLKALVLVLADMGEDNDKMKKEIAGSAIINELYQLYFRYSKSESGSQEKEEAKKKLVAFLEKHGV